VTLFAPKLPAMVQPNYAEIPFTMKLQGEFTTVLNFLYDFSRMNRIVNITEVKIGAPKMVDDKREILHITVDCAGSTYRSLTEEEVVAAKDPKKKGKG
jgi:Tfp pilus assembly protein PilO